MAPIKYLYEDKDFTIILNHHGHILIGATGMMNKVAIQVIPTSTPYSFTVLAPNGQLTPTVAKETPSSFNHLPAFIAHNWDTNG